MDPLDALPPPTVADLSKVNLGLEADVDVYRLMLMETLRLLHERTQQHDRLREQHHHLQQAYQHLREQTMRESVAA